MDETFELLMATHDQQELDPPDVADIKPIGEDVVEHGNE